MATLTGKITDVTGRAPDSISSITVKAPSARIGGGTEVVTTSPAKVDFNSTTGSVTVSNLTGGLSWLYIEGDGWADSIPLAVAEGMITLAEAIANAAGAPGLTDLIKVLLDLQARVDEMAEEIIDDAIVQIEDSISAKVVKSLPVRRIITSANPDEHLSEGDLLLVTDPPELLYRRFESMDGVTQRWAVGSWDIATDSLDGESVSLRTSGTRERRLASVDAVSGLADVDAVAKVKASSFSHSGGSSPGLVLRGAGNAGSETGYTASISTGQIALGKFINGAHTAIAYIPATIPVGEWLWLRFRAFRSSLQVKIWPDGTSEPAEWLRTVSDSSISEGGWIGPYASTNTSDIFWHSIGVAALTSGDEQAPTEAV